MNKIHISLISLSVLCLTVFLQGCIMLDDDSWLVRHWNDGHVLSEKEATALGDCSRESYDIQARDRLTNDESYKVYLQCMIDKGYSRRYYKSILKTVQKGSK